MPTIEVSQQGPVVTVTLNRPEVRNAFNETLIAELTAWAEAVAAGRRRPRGRASRRRQGLLRRRGPRVDVEDGRLLARREHARRTALPRGCSPRSIRCRFR